MNKMLDAFMEYLQDVKNTSENTRLSYGRDLQKLQKFLADKEIEDVTDIREEHLREYVAGLEKQGFKATTVSRHIVSIKAFCQFLYERQLIRENIAEGLTAPKIEKKLPEILTVEEVELLLEQPDKDTPKGLRDKAMLELLYATGIRVTELLELKLPDLYLQLGFFVCGE